MIPESLFDTTPPHPQMCSSSPAALCWPAGAPGAHLRAESHSQIGRKLTLSFGGWEGLWDHRWKCQQTVHLDLGSRQDWVSFFSLWVSA